jgi:hypothetical protein
MKTTTASHHDFAHTEGKAKVEVCLLGDICNGFALEVMAMLTVHHDIALVINESSEGFEQGGLASAVGADNSNQFTSTNVK